MRLEYLAEGSPDCPLIRLYRFDRAQALQLRELVEGLASGARDHVALHEEPAFEAIGGCRLHLRAGVEDRGICHPGAVQFECVLSPNAWDMIADLLQPFCESDAGAFQWLDDHGDVSLLLSRDGSW